MVIYSSSQWHQIRIPKLLKLAWFFYRGTFWLVVSLFLIALLLWIDYKVDWIYGIILLISPYEETKITALRWWIDNSVELLGWGMGAAFCFSITSLFINREIDHDLIFFRKKIIIKSAIFILIALIIIRLLDLQIVLPSYHPFFNS